LTTPPEPLRQRRIAQPAHIAYVVTDLDHAARTLGTWGLTFVPTLDRELDVVIGGLRQTHHLRAMWSLEGPPHIELLGAVEGTPWIPTSGAHHVGYWVATADFEAVLDQLSPALIELRSDPRADFQFAYVRDPVMGRIELVDEARKTAIARALGHGPFAAGTSPQSD
jgi:hypothetical protein